MKQIKGTPYNIENDILGRITFKSKNIFNRSNDILVSQNDMSTISGYIATITNKSEISVNKPAILGVDISQFNEGDVVLITKTGMVSFLYEIKSHQNIIFTTAKCNHRCIMCPQPPVEKDNDRTEFNLKLISLFDKNTQEVGISGGEPTMVGDDLFRIIKQIKKYCPKAAITILTNGVKFADKEYAMKLAMCRHQDLQIDVPLFSDISSIHNHIVGAKTFYKTIQGLYNLALFHQKIGIRIVIHKQTYNRLVQLADFIYHNLPFVTQVAFMEMETIGMAEKNIEELWIDPHDYDNELREAVLLLNDRGLNPIIYNGQLCVMNEDIRPFAVQSISDWKDIYLSLCEGCALRGKCAGFFESNRKYHSKHIKPQLDYTPMTSHADGIDNFAQMVSPYIKGNYHIVEEYKNGIIYDLPVGYGRNALWLNSLGFNVVGIDLDSEALNFLNEYIIKHQIENMKLIKENILNYEGPQADVIINVHLYSKELVDKIISLVKPGGILILETPDMHGENDKGLPQPNELNNYLNKNKFYLLDYHESNGKFGYVTVQLIARKE